MLFVIGLLTGALLLLLAQRRAQAIRLRVERRWGDLRPSSWEGWHQALSLAHLDGWRWGERC